MAIFYHGRHSRPKLTTAIISVVAVIVAFMTWMTVSPANASGSYGGSALNWAEANATGHWYQWGGTGPNYDCSGLVYKAFLHEGITLPRTTYGMLGSWHLV